MNAFAGVKSPPSKVNKPYETTVITTEMLFGKKPLPCKATDRIRRKEKSAKQLYPYQQLQNTPQLVKLTTY